MTDINTWQEAATEIAYMNRLIGNSLEHKGFRILSAELTVRHGGRLSYYLSWGAPEAGITDESKFFYGDKMDELIENLREYVATITTVEGEKVKAATKQVADALEAVKDLPDDSEFDASKIRVELSKALTHMNGRLLTYQPEVNADDLPF